MKKIVRSTTTTAVSLVAVGALAASWVLALGVGCGSSKKKPHPPRNTQNGSPPPPPPDTEAVDDEQPILLSIAETEIHAQRPRVPLFSMAPPKVEGVPQRRLRRLRRGYARRKGARKAKAGVALAEKLLYRFMKRSYLARKNRKKNQAMKEGEELVKLLKEAATVLQSVVQMKTLRPQALALYARVLEVQGDGPRALQVWRRYVSALKGKKSKWRPYARVRLATDALRRNDIKGARSLLRALKGQTKELKAVVQALDAWASFFSGRFEQAYKKTKAAYKRAARQTEKKGAKRGKKRGRDMEEPNESLLSAQVNRNLLLQQLVVFYSHARKAQRARRELGGALLESDKERLPAVLWSLLDLYFASGRYAEVVKLKGLSDDDGVDSFAVTVALIEAHLGLGDENAALAYLARLAKRVGAGTGDTKKKLSPKKAATVESILTELAKNLHTRFTKSFIVSDGTTADRAYELLLGLPTLEAKKKKEILKYRGELQRFHREVQKGTKTNKEKMAPGMLTGDVAARVVRRHASQIRGCVQRHLLRQRPLPRKALLQVTFTPAGAVTEASIMSIDGTPTPANENRTCPKRLQSLCSCITRKCLRWRFPAYRGKRRPTLLQIPLIIDGRQSAPAPTPSSKAAARPGDDHANSSKQGQQPRGTRR